MAVRLRQTVTETHQLESYPKFAQEAMRKAANKFVDKILPQHFTEEGASEYGYEPRAPEYEARKLRKFGHKRPLELTGDTKLVALRRSVVRVLGAGHRKRSQASAVVSVPFQIGNFSPQRRREIQATSRRDGAILAVEIEDVLTKRLNQKSSPKVVTP